MVKLQSIVDLINNADSISEIANKLDVSTDELKKMMIQSMRRTCGEDVEFKQFDNSTKQPKANDSSDEYSEDSDTEDNNHKRVNTGNESFDEIVNSAGVDFSDEQIEFMKSAIIDRKSIALLAPAGYGKSQCLETTMKLFKKCVKQDGADFFDQTYHKNNGEYLQQLPVAQICASTGRAASLIKARTIHSLLGIGLARGDPAFWYDRLLSAKYLAPTHDMLMAVQCIVVDEISMIGGKLLDKISDYLKMIKHCEKPFGGVQMIFVGDFAQMPPINDTFAFQSNAYKSAETLQVRLTKCFRQTDPIFKRILDNLRFGNTTTTDIKILRNCTSIDEEFSGGLKPTMLRSTNKEVDDINERQLQVLCDSTNEKTVTYAVRSNVSKTITKQRCKTYVIPEFVELAIGAQVMVTFNISSIIVNGTIGVVTMMDTEFVRIKLPDGMTTDIPYIGFKDPNTKDVYSAPDLFKYMPLRIAYAISIHKAQGATIPLLEVDCSRIFVSGQLYVAISRARDMKGLIVKSLSERAIMCSPLVKKFYGVE